MKCLQQYMVASTIVRRAQSALDYLSILIDLLKANRNITHDIRTQIFHTCQLIGVVDKQSLAEKRMDLAAFDAYSECRLLIDTIEGNKLAEEHQTAMNRTHDELIQMEQRVIQVEDNLDNVNDAIEQYGVHVSNTILKCYIEVIACAHVLST
jgi:hypothetical protein